MATGRVATRAGFAALTERGTRARRGTVGVTYLAEGDGVAVAYAIGKPVGTAVVRNRLRRRLRALVADLELPAGSYLVSASRAATELGPGALRADLAGAVDRAVRR